ncbi:hypothetical protein Vafri_14632 [Volvox africanus]|uniref:Uncharacterized protein n=1 Tax=Volvox africanus TaxID=51714 RepID=A0A8J4BEQ4_9CHLO|nr:hypothetical protein Vafri_14632 [Volvox africanus]
MASAGGLLLLCGPSSSLLHQPHRKSPSSSLPSFRCPCLRSPFWIPVPTGTFLGLYLAMALVMWRLYGDGVRRHGHGAHAALVQALRQALESSYFLLVYS